MQSKIILTGAMVYLSEYGVTIRTDLFLLDRVFHFYVKEGCILRNITEAGADLIVHKLAFYRGAGREALAHRSYCIPQPSLTRKLQKMESP